MRYVLKTDINIPERTGGRKWSPMDGFGLKNNFGLTIWAETNCSNTVVLIKYAVKFGAANLVMFKECRAYASGIVAITGIDWGLSYG
jgi:hypothetical protein